MVILSMTNLTRSYCSLRWPASNEHDALFVVVPVVGGCGGGGGGSADAGAISGRMIILSHGTFSNSASGV